MMAIASVEPGKTRIGWVGTGVMASSMCGHLLEAGFLVNVYNRTREKAEKLLQRGARWAETPKGIAEASDLIFTMVGYPSDVRERIGTMSGPSQRPALHAPRKSNTLVPVNWP